MTTNRERQAKFRSKMTAEGMEQVTGWVHPAQAAKLKLLIKALRLNPELECGPAVHELTRRFVKYD